MNTMGKKTATACARMPLISVLVPVYNREQYIAQTLDSILAQDYRNIEILVVDDGSTDRTRKIVASYRAPVRCIHQDNAGVAAARNTLLSLAAGALIAWCDSDDCYMDGKLSAQVEYLDQHPEAEIVFTKYDNFVEAHADAAIRARMKSEQDNMYCLPTSCARKSLYDKVGCFDARYVLAEDLDYIFRMQMVYGVDTKHCIAMPYYRRRLHGENLVLTHPQDKKLHAAIMAENLKKKMAAEKNSHD